jgi:hypothetical protein
MTAFVIAKKNSEFLDTPVFRAGADGREEAIAVFTSRETAEKYITDAGWTAEQEVGELQPIQLLRWIVTAYDQGTQMVVVDPTRARHLAGEPQSVVYLDEPMGTFAELLRSEFIKKTEGHPAAAD